MLKNSLFQPFSVSALPPCFFFFLPFFSFQFTCALFFQPKNILFSPKQFSFRPKNIFFSPNVFQFFSPNVFQLFSPNVFASVQPLFSSSFFLLYSFLVQPSFFSLAPFIQGRIFSLAASHLFYLNKSLFSSNLE